MRTRRALAVAALLWAVCLPAAAFAASRPASAAGSYAFALAIYGVGRVICHQLPSRSFHLWSVQLPVCARCTGIYAGAAVAALAQLVVATPFHGHGHITSGGPRKARVLLLVSALPVAATLVFEWGTGQTPSNLARALSGLPLGAAISWIILRAVN